MEKTSGEQRNRAWLTRKRRKTAVAGALALGCVALMLAPRAHSRAKAEADAPAGVKAALWAAAPPESVQPLAADPAERSAAPGEGSAPPSVGKAPRAAGRAPQIIANQAPQLARVWVYWDAVYPSVMTLRPGPVLFRVENRTPLDANIVVDNVSAGAGAQTAATATAASGALQGIQSFQLGPGEYVYYERSRPQLKGRLIVT